MPVFCECCVLSGRGLCYELITRLEESYLLLCVVVCDLENLMNEEALVHWGLSRQKQTNKSLQCYPLFNSTFSDVYCTTIKEIKCFETARALKKNSRLFNTFTAIVDHRRFNNLCLKSPASTLVDLTFQSRALRSFSLNQLRNLSL